MANTRQVKQRIQTAGNISKITKAMEMVSASKMKRAQDQALSARPYSKALANSLHTLASASDPSLHPLLSEHESGVDVCIVITTDRGLCGSMNALIAKAMHEWLLKHRNGKIIMIGKKGIAFSRITGIELYAQFAALPERLTTADILPISSLAIENFTNQQFKSVHLIYTDFINTLSQKVQVTPVLPLAELKEEARESLADVSEKHDYVFEPSAQEILSQLLPYYVENVIYQAFLESRASEHSARMVAMKNASENAQDLVKELKLVFNKTRQASITTELLDITTATLSLTK